MKKIVLDTDLKFCYNIYNYDSGRTFKRKEN